ncbi:hypothetical protein DEM27_10665 [Metarhizobium album]|uniref:Uncharacterized protein n=1 Tax=Metarhizobium album TaxID=2182425 RepID=A0A2U2DRJ4_9HYPH|nr:hypothetical protein [Rhizobium album]PWE55911.1 hypothetical protein DEM27_10665 [Rhizobium album]
MTDTPKNNVTASAFPSQEEIRALAEKALEEMQAKGTTEREAWVSSYENVIMSYRRLALAKQQIADKEALPGYWRPISTAPEHVWIRTKLSTEKGENVCMRIPHKGYEDEWVERGTGISTVTHHSFAAPDRWRPLSQAGGDDA